MAVIDFSAKVLSKTHEIYQEGSSREQGSLDVVSKDLRSLCEGLKLSVEDKVALTKVKTEDDRVRPIHSTH